MVKRIKSEGKVSANFLVYFSNIIEKMYGSRKGSQWRGRGITRRPAAEMECKLIVF